MKYSNLIKVAPVLCLLLSACANGKLSSLYQSLADAATGHSENFVTAEMVANVPYASMSAQIGTGPVSLLVLGDVDDGRLSWYSADRNVFVTRKGRLVKTAGLPANMNRADYEPAHDPVWQFNRDKPKLQSTARMHTDLLPDNIYNLVLDCKYEYKGRGIIRVLDKSRRTDAVAEHCVAATIGWEFTNLFWIGVEGQKRIWQSIQYIHPKVPPVKFQLTKKPNVL